MRDLESVVTQSTDQVQLVEKFNYCLNAITDTADINFLYTLYSDPVYTKSLLHKFSMNSNKILDVDKCFSELKCHINKFCNKHKNKIKCTPKGIQPLKSVSGDNYLVP